MSGATCTKKRGVPFFRAHFWGKRSSSKTRSLPSLFSFRFTTREKANTDHRIKRVEYRQIYIYTRARTMGSLFQVYNSFHLGAYQVAINEASDLLDLSPSESVEKDCYVYRSYIALGSYQVRLFSRFFRPDRVRFICVFLVSLSRCIVSLSVRVSRRFSRRSFFRVDLFERSREIGRMKILASRALSSVSLSLSPSLCRRESLLTNFLSLSLSLPLKNSWSWTKSRTIPRPLYKR